MLTLFIELIKLFRQLLTDVRDVRAEIQDVKTHVKHLEVKVATLAEQITKLEQDAGNVTRVIGVLKTQVEELTAIVADLQANGATAENIARLQAVDDTLDAVAPDVSIAPPIGTQARKS